MLQVVLGLDAARIASAFLVAPAAMGQRLVRAKTRIRDAGIGFQLPGVEALPERVEAVLAAIYAAYGAGWEDVTGADVRRRGLTGEALALARIVCALAPREAEAWGLAALMLHCEARAAARRSPAGVFTPLSKQDPQLWSAPMIAEAEEALRRAAALGRIGRFQLEAAIQSLHVSRATDGRATSDDLLRLYEGWRRSRRRWGLGWDGPPRWPRSAARSRRWRASTPCPRRRSATTSRSGCCGRTCCAPWGARRRPRRPSSGRSG